MITLPQAIGMRGSTAAAWSPADLGAALWAWYDAEAQGGTDGVAVSEVTDQSGNGIHLATGGSKPYYRATSFSGSKPCYDCATSRTANRTLGAAHTETAMSFLMAIRVGAQANAGRIVTLRNAGDYADGTALIPCYQYDAGPYNVAALRNTTAIVGSSTAALNDYVIFASMFKSGSGKVWYNGGTAVTGTPTGTSISFSTVEFGGWAGVSAFCNGLIAEMLLIDGEIVDEDREKAEGYLAHKYSLTGNLPALHPYKTTPP